MIRVLVCGGRNYTDQQNVWENLSGFHMDYGPIACLIQGGARGADRLAKNWALMNHIPIKEFPADWDQHGKRAGFLRNQQMIDEGCPHRVIAFPGGRGTADMVRRAKTAGIPVREIADRPRAVM